MKKPTVEELRERREKWIEDECEFVNCPIHAACPYCVYDKYGFPKCDYNARICCGCE